MSKLKELHHWNDREQRNPCLSSIFYSILLNGSPHDRVTPTRGLRQGDPLSPFLFVIRMEILSHLLTEANSLSLMQGIRLNRNGPSINHLLYADNLLIFGQASLVEAKNIDRCLRLFSLWSGQAPNAQKSSILITANTDHSSARLIRDLFGFPTMSSSSRHLGLPLILPRLIAEAFKDLQHRIECKVSGWKGKLLSQAGRNMLIKSVASSIPIYSMSSFLITQSICKNIDSLLRKFWWGYKLDGKQHLSLQSWNQICTPKSEGGMGIKKVQGMNLAFLSKLGWQMLSPHPRPWVKCLSAKYLQYSKFLQVECHAASSWIWKGILKSRLLIS